MSITQVITALPTAPQRTDDPDTFITRADAFVAALPTMVTQENAWATQANSTASTINSDKIAAATSASESAAYAGDSETASDASIAAANYAGVWSLLSGPLSVPASVEHNGAIWLLLNSLADVTASEPGVDADWALINGTPLESRSSAVILTAADRGKIIDLTGTFTQTFLQASTLGSGWYVTLKNIGDGDITLDPDGSEQIDGLTDFIMYPGEMRMIICTGTAFQSYVINGFERDFDTSGTFIKPPGYSAFDGLVWGGGGGGVVGYGGGGGACVPFKFKPSAFGATETITVAAGGATGVAGGNSSIGSLIVAYGGGPGSSGSNFGGGGGGALSVGSSPAGGEPLNIETGTDSGFGGGRGDNGVVRAQFSTYGGGGGGGGVSGSGASSLYGGGGGGSGAGSSVFGGDGGASGQNGQQPAGGGGAGTMSGGDGRVRIRGII